MTVFIGVLFVCGVACVGICVVAVGDVVYVGDGIEDAGCHYVVIMYALAGYVGVVDASVVVCFIIVNVVCVVMVGVTLSSNSILVRIQLVMLLFMLLIMICISASADVGCMCVVFVCVGIWVNDVVCRVVDVVDVVEIVVHVAVVVLFCVTEDVGVCCYI